jgi:hypothetical protein
MSASKNNPSIYAIGAVLGLTAGFLDVKFGDLLLTALFVMAATMLLGALRPQRPWRWTLLVAVFVPLVQGGAYLLLTEKPVSRTNLRVLPWISHRSCRRVWRIGRGHRTG